MARDFAALEKSMERRMAKFKVDVAKKLRGTVRVGAEELIENTPVDTGEARSNWRVTEGLVEIRTFAPFFPLKKGTDTFKFYESSNANAAKAVCFAQIAAIPDEVIFEGTPVFVQNHAWQTAVLNRGTPFYSRQGAGSIFFVERAVKVSRLYASGN